MDDMVSIDGSEGDVYYDDGYTEGQHQQPNVQQNLGQNMNEHTHTHTHNHNEEKFWIYDICSLFKSFRIFPTSNMTLDEKFNAVTRLLILVCVVLYIFNMYLLEIPTYIILNILFIGLVIIILLRSHYKSKKEGFAIVPTYLSPNFQQTAVAPLFAEEQQIYPPAYDLYENVPPPTSFDEPLKPQEYPYMQYLTRTNTLPNDEYNIRQLNGGVREAREYENSAFLRHRMAFQDNMMAIHKKKLQRRFRNNTSYDTFSPYTSY